MKKIIAFILLTVTVFTVAVCTASAIEPEIIPYYESDQGAKTRFTVNTETRLAQIYVYFLGDPEEVSGIDINVMLQKKNMITSTWITKEEWSVSTTQSSYSNTFTKSVMIGQHRAIVEYTIHGFDGSTDVITHTREYVG